MDDIKQSVERLGPMVAPYTMAAKKTQRAIEAPGMLSQRILASLVSPALVLSAFDPLVVHKEDTPYPVIDPDMKRRKKSESLIRKSGAVYFSLNSQDIGPELIASWAVELTEQWELLLVVEVVTRLHGEDPTFLWRSPIYRTEAASYGESTFRNSPATEIADKLVPALRALEGLLALWPAPDTAAL